MKNYLLKVENVPLIPKTYLKKYMTQYQGSKGHSATSDGWLYGMAMDLYQFQFLDGYNVVSGTKTVMYEPHVSNY